jgi:hypothetical protein
MNPPSILLPHQREFLNLFFLGEAAQQFFLTGGSALAEFYLHHRHSEDIDLFTLDESAFNTVPVSIPVIAATLGGSFEERFATVSFRQVFIRIPDLPEIKIDLVRDVGPQFGEHQRFGSLIVDSELNIAVNKVTTLFGRADPKDFVDLYFLLKRGYDLAELFKLAKEKDLGFTEFYFAGMLRQAGKLRSLPRMVEPLTVDELGAFFEPLAEDIVRRLKPPR